MPTLPRMGWMCFGVSRKFRSRRIKFRSRRTQSMILIPLCGKKIALNGEKAFENTSQMIAQNK
jgi:hypothetical protein